MTLHLSFPTPTPTVVASQPQARSRIVRLLAAWADWLLWRLQPPRIPRAEFPSLAPGGTRVVAACPKPAVGDADLPTLTLAKPAAPASPAAGDAGMAAQIPEMQDAGALQDIAPAADALRPASPMNAAAMDLARALEDDLLRGHLQQMIRDELAGEMGARFSGNIQAVIRREVAAGLDDRLTHL